MKALKIIGIIIGFLILVVVSIGVVVPSFEYGNTVKVSEPPDACWRVFTDTSKRAQWIDGLKSYKLIEGRPFEAGAEYETIIVDGETMVMHERIEQVDPSRKILLRLTNDVLTSEYSYAFEGDLTSTTITTHYHVTGNNVFMRAILFMSKSYLKSSDQKMLTSLKGVIESAGAH